MPGKIKILRVVNSLNIGGLEKGVVNVALNLNKNKFEQVFCCLGKKGVLADRLEKDGIKVFSLNKQNGLGLGLPFKIRALIKKENPDIIEMHNTDPFQQGMLASFFMPNLVKIRTDHNSFASPISSKVLLFNRLLSKFCDKTIVVSNKLKRNLVVYEKIDPDQIFVIHNGVDLSKVGRTANVLQVRKSFKLEKGSNVVTYIGGLREEKRLDVLVKSFSLVSKELPNSILLLVGDGPLRRSLTELAKREGISAKIKFLGLRQDVYDLIKASNVVTLSSTSEGISQTIMEAMACSKPVVATKVGGNPELVQDGKTGFLVPPENPEKLAEVIITLLRNKKLGERMGKNGRKRVEKYFNIDKTVSEYEKVYIGLFKKNHSKR